MKHNIFYILIVSIVFGAYAIVFDTFERSTYSELEKRELATFPAFSTDSLWSGDYAKAVASWFSDTEPFRDVFMIQSMRLKQALRISLANDEEAITFHAADDALTEDAAAEKLVNDRDLEDYDNKVTADENAKVANYGILIVGKGKETRALMAYGAGEKAGEAYAKLVNHYKEEFPDVNIYCMAIPTASEYYCPDRAKSRIRSQRASISYMYSVLRKDVKAVDVYSALGRHASEDIFLRTDHHWAPLGAYYAAEQLCRVAGVPFRDLSHYDKHVVPDFVGTMYGYSRDISVKENPEDFVYWTPKTAQYETSYTIYRINKKYQVTSVLMNTKSKFFHNIKGGSAYCTFMGSDARITKVHTNVNNHRRIIILKDSFGNAIPGYLFYSFEEIHVLDYRYFTKNIKEYVRENKITDIVFANNTFPIASPSTINKYMKFLTQHESNAFASPTPEDKKPATSKEEKPAARKEEKSNTRKEEKSTTRKEEKSNTRKEEKSEKPATKRKKSESHSQKEADISKETAEPKEVTEQVGT